MAGVSSRCPSPAPQPLGRDQERGGLGAPPTVSQQRQRSEGCVPAGTPIHRGQPGPLCQASFTLSSRGAESALPGLGAIAKGPGRSGCIMLEALGTGFHFLLRGHAGRQGYAPPPTPLVARSLQVGALAVPQGGLEPTLLPCSRGEALSDSRAAAPCPHPCLPRTVRPAPSGASPPLLRDPGLSPASPDRHHQHMPPPPQPGLLPGLPTGPAQSPVDKGRPGPRTLRGSRRTSQEGRPLLTGQKSQASGRK